MAAFVVHAGPREPLVDRVAAALQGLVDGVFERDDVTAVHRELIGRRGAALVIVIDRPGSTAALEGAVDFASRHGSSFVIYVADEISALDYKRLLSTGGADWVHRADAGSEIPAAVRRWLNRLERGNGGERLNSALVCFLPTGGGVGNTTLCVETAVHLASKNAKEPMRVCLVDLDLQRGNACDLIDAEPHMDLTELSRSPERLDDHMLAIFATKTSFGLDVYAGQRYAINPDSIRPEAIFALLNGLNGKYDIILVDFPSVPGRWAEDVLRNSDRLILTGIYSVPSALRISAMLKHLKSAGVPLQDSCVAVSKVPRGFFGRGLKVSEFQKSIDASMIFYMADDQRFALECANLGQPMMAASRRRRICRDIRQLADKFVAPERKASRRAR